MKDNLIKVICFILAIFMIMPSMPANIVFGGIILQDEYVKIDTANNTSSGGDRTLQIEIYVGGELKSSETRKYSGNAGNTTVTAVSPYVISRMETKQNNGGWSNFTGGSISISSNSPKTTTLRIYLVKDNKIVDNELVTVQTGTVPANSGNRTLYIDTYILDEKIGDTITAYYSSNPGSTTIVPNSGYAVSNIKLDGSNFSSGSNMTINSGSKRISIYLTAEAVDNNYIKVEAQKVASGGSKTLVVETYAGGVLAETETIRYSDNPGKINMSVKSGYTAVRMESKSGASTWNRFNNSGNITISDNGTLTLRVYVIQNKDVVDNEYVLIQTNTAPNIDGTRELIVELYVDDKFEESMYVNYSSSPGNTYVTEKSGYKITGMQTKTTGSWSTFNSGGSLSISSNNSSRTLKVNVEKLKPKNVNINYYYDDVIQPDRAVVMQADIGKSVTVPLEVHEGHVFQKAKISEVNLARNIDIVTKEVSFIMPDKDITLDYYYGSEGQVKLNKSAMAIPGATNEFYIDLSVEGTPIVTRRAADIVLVFDESGSMEYALDTESKPTGGKPSRMKVLKDAADTFINRIMPADEISMNQVSIVTYSGTTGDGAWNDAKILKSFTSLNSEVKASYSGLTGNGGTNTQAGFMKAEDAFRESNGARDRDDVERFVIYMTDGAAGYYYNNSGNTAGTGSPGLNPDTTAASKAIEAAKNLKENTGAKIYTVALISNDVGAKKVLDPKEIVGGVEKNVYQEAYYKATTADQLTGIYSLLASKISDEIATNAVVTDTLPDDFKFKTDDLPQDVAIDDDGMLTWNLSTINTVEKSIRVSAKYYGDKYGLSFANKNCGISYVHNNTPNEITTRVFEVPMGVLAPVIELPTQNVGYNGSIIINPLPSAYDNKKLNQGENKGYVVSDLMVSLFEAPKHGTAALNSDGTFTYTSFDKYTGPDSFKYKVTMEITNEYGSDSDALCGTYTTITTVNINVEEKPTFKLTMEYAYKDGDVFKRDVYNFAPGEAYNITPPEVSGWKPLTGAVTGTMPKSDVIIVIYYTRIQNILMNNSMYPNKGLSYSLMGPSKAEYSISSGIGYTFGFEFKAGYNFKDAGYRFDLLESGSSGTYTLNNFKLYEGNVLKDSKSKFSDLDKNLVTEGKIYTITYSLEFTSQSGGVILKLDSEHIDTNGKIDTIKISASKMPVLQ